jgi:hypothetical protein
MTLALIENGLLLIWRRLSRMEKERLNHSKNGHILVNLTDALNAFDTGFHAKDFVVHYQRVRKLAAEVRHSLRISE